MRRDISSIQKDLSQKLLIGFPFVSISGFLQKMLD